MNVQEAKRVDLWDGGDRHNFGFFIDKSVSNEAITAAHPHCMITTTVVVVYANLQEVKENDKLKLKRRAYDKLTPQEREALGMKERP